MSCTWKRSHVAVMASLAFASLAACGSTVRDVGLASLGGQAGTTLGLPGSNAFAPKGSPLGETLAPGQLAANGTNGQTTSAGVTDSGQQSTGSGGSLGRSVVPATKPIVIGVTAQVYTALIAAAGVNAGTQDPFAGYKAMFDYINKHGGLAGHQIQAIYYKMNAASNDYASEAQAACAYFTQDHHINLAFSVDASNFENLTTCFEKAGVTQFDLNQWASDTQNMTSHPNLYVPDALGADHSALTELEVAFRRGWLSSKDRLGVLFEDCAIDNRVYNQVISPWAQQHGIKLDKATTSCINGEADMSSAASQIQQAELKFRSDGVTVVTVPSAAEGGGVALFSRTASSQNWHPSYIITSNAFPYDNSSSTFSVDQLPKMHGIGWSPHFDVGARAVAQSRQAQAIKACHTLDPGDGDAKDAPTRTNGLEWFYSECDTVQLMRTMVTTSGGDIGIAALGRVYASAAASTPSAKNPAGVLGAVSGRRDGAADVVPFSYKVGGCGCFSYDAGPEPTS